MRPLFYDYPDALKRLRQRADFHVGGNCSSLPRRKPGIARRLRDLPARGRMVRLLDWRAGEEAKLTETRLDTFRYSSVRVRSCRASR